ncbi:unnamed protein product, partial [Vitis vinifera]
MQREVWLLGVVPALSHFLHSIDAFVINTFT